jgi:succinate dehydrogenase/fumarate reductase flavoprotein subunit
MAGREADLVVVGFGAAGAAAALRAAELGASVLLLEKQPRDRHTPNTRMSGGHIMTVNDVEQAFGYLDRCAGGMIPPEVTRAWAERAHELVAWLDAPGTDLRLRRAYGAEHPEFEGAAGVDVHMQARLQDGTAIDFSGSHSSSSAEGQGAVRSATSPDIRSGRHLFAALAAAVEARPEVEIVWETPGARLLRDADGRVSGVEANGSRFHARAGVVLASGGYEYDEALKLDHLRAYPMEFYGNPGNTGDGVRMAQAAGADLWHMNQMIGRAIGHFELEDGGELNVPIVIAGGAYVLLDQDCKRFANEVLQANGRHDFYYELLVYESERARYPRIPCYWFFDAERLRFPIVNQLTGATVVGIYDWSPDNSREVERGWIHTGATVEEAAAKAGLDPAAAAAAVREYNELCASGREDPLGRPRESLVPIDEAPICCVPLYPGGSNSAGGPRRNERAEIVDPFGEPIPGLYGAGELGQAMGLLYPAGGCNISEALCFGQIAAESALAS